MNKIMAFLGTSAGPYLLIVTSAFAIFFGVKSCNSGRAAERLALKADSLQASADTTRNVSWRANKVLGDSLAAVERRTIQTPGIKRDELDKVLSRVTVLTTRLDATIRKLNVQNGTGTSVVVDSKDVRSSTFHVDSTPYHVDASVRLPPPPALGKIDLAVRLDTVSLRPRLQCGKAVDNVRPATILVETPTWLTAKIVNSQVDVSACNPKRGWSLPLWAVPAAFGAGYVVKSIWK